MTILDAYADGVLVGQVEAAADDTRTDLLVKLAACRRTWLDLDYLPLGDIRFMIHKTDAPAVPEINHRSPILKRSTSGFTLIELMIVVAIIAILASVALPAYQSYTTRAKVSEALAALSACKTSITEYRQAMSDWPADMQASGCSDQSTAYVSTLAVGDKGVITATLKTGPNAVDPDAAGNLELTPTLLASGHIAWTCAGVGTTVKTKYLPALCRN